MRWLPWGKNTDTALVNYPNVKSKSLQSVSVDYPAIKPIQEEQKIEDTVARKVQYHLEQAYKIFCNALKLYHFSKETGQVDFRSRHNQFPQNVSAAELIGENVKEFHSLTIKTRDQLHHAQSYDRKLEHLASHLEDMMKRTLAFHGRSTELPATQQQVIDIARQIRAEIDNIFFHLDHMFRLLREMRSIHYLSSVPNNPHLQFHEAALRSRQLMIILHNQFDELHNYEETVKDLELKLLR